MLVSGPPVGICCILHLRGHIPSLHENQVVPVIRLVLPSFIKGWQGEALSKGVQTNSIDNQSIVSVRP